MFISRVFIKNFRNLKLLDVEIGPGVTCFIGENNAGKTNLLQAIRLLLDGNLSAGRRRLRSGDLSAGLTFRTPEQVLISVEFSDFADRANEAAFPFSAVLANGRARLTYRFRPKALVRSEFEDSDDAVFRPLGLDDYAWEIAAGGDEINLAEVSWIEDFGSRYSTDQLQQGYLVVLMEALRDVESRLSAPRTSPLQQIIEQRRIPEDEQTALVEHLQTANTNINASATIGDIGQNLSTAFRETVGDTFSMDVSLGLGEPDFADITRGLKVLLSGFGMTALDPSRNGLGLNNILFISMLQHYFERRMAEGATAGQLLLVEEPEAHLHPQLQRVLLETLQGREVQIFITTHSTHITSAVPLSSQIVLTSNGGAASTATKLTSIPGLEPSEISDLERYLDATRSALLYARRVLLVEGPAEQFLVAPLVKTVMGIDLDKEGIVVVPIFGTHFKSYAKLFGPGGIEKKCAILTDGDLVPSDATIDEEEIEDDGDPIPTRQELNELEGNFVRVFTCETTFEREITLAGNLRMLAAGTAVLGATRTTNQLNALIERVQSGTPVNLTQVKGTVLNAAKRFGKARFAQTISTFSDQATELPAYITEAIDWLRTDAIDR